MSGLVGSDYGRFLAARLPVRRRWVDSTSNSANVDAVFSYNLVENAREIGQNWRRWGNIIANDFGRLGSRRK